MSTAGAHGWTNVEPYFELRDLLEPNTGGGYWNVPSGDCYVGLAPALVRDVWGYHYFENSLIHDRAYQEFGRESSRHPAALRHAAAHVRDHSRVEPLPGQDQMNPRGPDAALVAREPNAYVYRVEGAARARVVRAARRMPTEAHAAARLREPGFDPDDEILLLDAPDSVHPTVDEAARGAAGREPGPGDHHARDLARARRRRGRAGGRLSAARGHVLSGLARARWTASPTPIYRANISLRGIALPKGQHTVRFAYEPASPSSADSGSR